MKKKEYIHPTVRIVAIRQQQHLLAGSVTTITAKDGDNDLDLGYDNNGEDPGNGW